MSATAFQGATITALQHDLVGKRSLVTLVWTGVPDKALMLPIPFGCTLDALPAEAEKALRALSAETASLAGHTVP